MKRMRILGLAILAVFALGAITAAGASAVEPGWYECAKEAGGKFEKGCGKEGGKGGYTLKPGIGKGKAFKGKGGLAKLHTWIPEKGDVPVECEKFTDSGNIALPNLTVKVVAKFSKCKAAGFVCQSGAKKGEIVTNPLAGELGYVEKAGPKVGASLASEAEPGKGLLAEFTCTGIAKVRTHGAVIGTHLGNINVINKSSETVYKIVETEPAPGFKAITNENKKFEGGPVEILASEFEQGKGWEPAGGLPSGQEGSASNKGEALMVKA
jgi:hypothetical protein